MTKSGRLGLFLEGERGGQVPLTTKYSTTTQKYVIFQFNAYISMPCPLFLMYIDLLRYRYRNAGGGAGNITIRAPCSAVGHGSMYHSQSVQNSGHARLTLHDSTGT